jgi:hypothetical protein
VAPANARIYSAQTFAFASANENSAMELLGRTNADGGGNTLYNLALKPGEKTRTWLEIGGDRITSDQRGDTPKFRSSSVSVQGGVDRQIGDIGRIGVGLGYQRINLDDSAIGRGKTDVVRASLYGSYPVGPVGLSAVLSYAHGADTTRREVGLGRADASYGTDQWLGAGQASVPLQFGALTVTPAAGVIASRMTGKGFAEGGAVPDAFRITGDIRDHTFVSPFATLGLSYVIDTASGGQWIPDVSIGYRRSGVAAGSDYVLTARDGTTFAGNQVALDRNSFTLGGSLTVHQGRWTGALKYRGQFAGGRQDNQLSFIIRLAL